jgi:hypothetical protein
MRSVEARALGLATFAVVGAGAIDGCSTSSRDATLTTSIVVPFQLPAFTFQTPPVTGKPFAAQFPAVGGRPPYRWTLSGGALPAGYTFDASGQLYGTSTQTGGYSFDVTATDADGDTLGGPVTGSFAASGTVDFAIGPFAPPQFGENEPLGFEPFVLGGTPPYTFEVTGLPPGVTFDPSTGTLSGSPTTSGNFEMAFALRDSSGDVASNSPMTFSFDVEPPQQAGGPGSDASSCSCSQDSDCASFAAANCDMPGAPNNGGVCGVGGDAMCHCCYGTCGVDPQSGAVSGCTCLGCSSACTTQIANTCFGNTCAVAMGGCP